jgi:GT2 family glycosyltransferase
MSFVAVIPSKNHANLKACVGAIRASGETCQIVVVDDSEGGLPLIADGVEIIPGVKPFVFARAVNQGIRWAGDADILVCNDDAILKTPQGLSMLSVDSQWAPEYGIVAASVLKSCGTLQQIHDDNPMRPRFRESPVMLAFICVYIPRRTIDLVGLLDERFSVNAGGPGKRGYGLEDDDYCWRVRAKGMNLGVDNDVVVDHTTLKSTFRHDKEHPADVFVHEEVFRQKWGRHPRDPRAWERPKLPK